MRPSERHYSRRTILWKLKIERLSSFFKRIINEIHTEDFENNTLDSFLEAMKNWIEDMDGYYKNIGMREYNDKTLNWSMLADILNASRIYE